MMFNDLPEWKVRELCHQAPCQSFWAFELFSEMQIIMQGCHIMLMNKIMKMHVISLNNFQIKKIRISLCQIAQSTFRAYTIKVAAMGIPCIDINKMTKSALMNYFNIKSSHTNMHNYTTTMRDTLELPITSVSNCIIYVIATIKTSRNSISNWKVHNVDLMISATFARAWTRQIFAPSHLKRQIAPILR